MTAPFSGEWLFVWPRDGWSKLDPHRVAADAQSLGFDGVILHSGLHAADEGAPRAGAFKAAGLRVACGVGGPRPTADNLDAIADGIVRAVKLAAPGGPYEGVEPDLEGAWDGHEDDAAHVVDRVLSLAPEAPALCADVPWWAPRTTPDGHATHPHWPLREFGRLVFRRFPQVYGAGMEGATARMLAWARSQYAQFGAWPIAPCVQGYKRSVADHCALYADEPDSLTWNYLELDAECRTARRAMVALRTRGFVGNGAIKRFQASAGLTADGAVGPKTIAALGL